MSLQYDSNSVALDKSHFVSMLVCFWKAINFSLKVFYLLTLMLNAENEESVLFDLHE